MSTQGGKHGADGGLLAQVQSFTVLLLRRRARILYSVIKWDWAETLHISTKSVIKAGGENSTAMPQKATCEVSYTKDGYAILRLWSVQK